MSVGGVWQPQELYNFAKQYGFNDAEAVVVVGTAAAESGMGSNRGPSSGNAIGLFQFIYSTFAGNANPNCQDWYSDVCQIQAFRNITKGHFQTAWFSNWFVNWNSNSIAAFNYTVKSLGSGVSLPANASNVLQQPKNPSTGVLPGTGGRGGTSPSMPDLPIDPTNPTNPLPLFPKILGPLQGFASGAAGNVAKDVAGSLLPYILLISAFVIILLLLAKEISSKGGPPQPGGAMTVPVE